MDDATLLTLVDDAIAAILAGGAPKRWQEGSHQIEHYSLLELYELKRTIEDRIADSSGPIFRPVREVNL